MNSDLIRPIKQLWADLRHDPEALFEARQLLFGILIAIGVTYGFYAIHVVAKQKVKWKTMSYSKQLSASLGGGEMEVLTSLQLQKLLKAEQELTEKTSLLQFKEKILKEQYSRKNNSDTFTNVIFTLLPISPVDIESGFVEMNVLDPRTYEYFDVSPINLKGEIGYTEFLYYLKYLEGRPEVGLIGNMNLELLLEEPFDDSGTVHFDIVLGRIELHPGQ